MSMTQDEFNVFCEGFPHTTHVVQWGGADVWKIGAKVFAIGGWNEGKGFCTTFKTSEIGFEMLRDARGCRPAPYLASRGMKWIQRTSAQSMSDVDLKDYIKQSYRIVSLGLTKKLQKELGLNQ